MWKNPFIRESIYLASKSLYNDLDNLFSATEKIDGLKKENLIRSFYKYLARMSNRATPFGLFAGCSALQWGTSLQMVLIEGFKRSITLDAAVNEQLAELGEIHDPAAAYGLNNTIYLQGKQYKFIVCQLVDGERLYEIVGLAYNEVIARLVNRMQGNAYTCKEMSALLGDFDPDESMAFINQLIQIQFLTYTGKPSIGLRFPDYLPQPWPKALQPELHLITTILERTADRYGVSETMIKDYQEIEISLKKLLGYTPANCIHVTKVNYLQKATVQNSLQGKLLRGIKLLHNLTDFAPQKRLKQFQTQFLQRYQGRSVSLLEAFDPDSGLEYGQWHNKETLFTEGLNAGLIRPVEQMPYTENNLKLLKVLTSANVGGDYTFILPEDFVPEKPLTNLPQNLAAVFQLFDQEQLFLEMVAGTGSLGLLARFADADDDIKQLAAAMAAKESLTNPDAIYAEIIHLPEERSANVMSHPQFWSHELAYINQAGGKQVINLDEIEVKLQNGLFKLFSKKEKKEIIPKLSSAYNYNRSQHPIYTFLCDIQHQNGPNGLSFNWGRLAGDFVFFPRIETSFGVILHRATWKFSAADLKAITKKTNNESSRSEAFKQFRLEWKIPDKFFVVNGDNELLIDVENALSVDVLLKEAAKTVDHLVLKECLHSQMEPVLQNESGQRYAHQFVAPLFAIMEAKKASYPLNQSTITRHYFPGSEWLYVKIFLNENTAQQVLIALYKLLDKNKGIIDYKKWFFIRYYEFGHHIRLRILLHSADDFQQTYFLVKKVLDPFILHQQISNIQLDTYEREIERYGAEQIELAESLFDVDSRFCSYIFLLFENNNYTEQGWLVIFWVMKEYLSRKSEDAAIQLKFAETQLAFFLKEMDSKLIKIQIDQLFRKYGAILPKLVEEYEALLNNRREEIEVLLEGKHVDWNDSFLAGVIHMLINRYFVNQQRLHECLLYGIMVKQLKSGLARASH
ncbi:lantibiotic dehydratase [Pedobacter suwonensis]|uniref:lantibiotic dehydratase n=1 Tax=Pedobacter suwonensis TaxID=332999 RepID=UPI0011A59A24|nr:lantibiotic dehydratase [Pedobacter suwonensis]